MIDNGLILVSSGNVTDKIMKTCLQNQDLQEKNNFKLRYSLGLQFLKDLNTLLKVEILEKPDCMAASVIVRLSLDRRSSAARILRRLR